MHKVLNVIIEGQSYQVKIDEDTLRSGFSLFNKMDEDMNKGWTMGRDFIENPTVTQRCQIVGDKLLTAMEDNNEQMKTMMVGYLLSRVPNLMSIHIDNTGNIQETQIELAPR